jgi:hypothetical protein
LTASKLEVQAIGALAARASARARAAGEADPFGAGHEIDQAALLAAGVSPTELAEAFVTAAVWLARTMSKAGQPQVAWPILDRAADRAGGSPALRATVRRARAEVHQRAGHRVRAVAARLLPPFPRQ